MGGGCYYSGPEFIEGRLENGMPQPEIKLHHPRPCDIFTPVPTAGVLVHFAVGGNYQSSPTKPGDYFVHTHIPIAGRVSFAVTLVHTSAAAEGPADSDPVSTVESDHLVPGCRNYAFSLLQ